MMFLPLLLLHGPVVAAPPTWVPDARFTLALYCNPTCDPTALDALDQSLSTIDDRRRLPRAASIAVRVMALVSTEEYGRPDIENLGNLADGLSEEGEKRLASSEQVVMASFASPIGQARMTLSLAYSAFADLAEKTGGIVEEVSTGRLYDAETFRAHARTVSTDPFDTTSIFIVEPIEDDGSWELSTQGLRAIGLQELRMEDVDPDRLNEMAAVLDGLAQISYEKGSLKQVTKVSEGTVQHPAVRKYLVGIDGIARASYATPRRGEADNPVARVTFEGVFDAPALAQPEGLTERSDSTRGASGPMPGNPPGKEETNVGAPSSVSPTAASVPATSGPKQPSTLEEALAEAASQLAGPIRQRYEAGLPAGDTLYVKAPFKADDGSIEYLWIAVTGWEGTTIHGVLRSEPTWVKGISAGTPVDVDQKTVFDYLLRHADGTREGNGTERFLR